MPLVPGSAAAPGFAERIGRAVFYPHRAVRALSQGEAGGLRDTALLFLPRLLVSDTQRLSAELAQVHDGGVRAVVQLTISAISALLPDVLGILLASVFMSLSLGESERQLRPGLTLDVGAQAWLGWLFLHVLMALGQTLLQREPEPFMQRTLPWVAFSVWLLYILIGFLTVRRILVEQAASATGSQATARGDLG